MDAAFVDAHAILAAASAHAGRLDDARPALAECVRQMPGLTVRDPRLVRPFRRAADQERFLDGLRKAGFARTLIPARNRGLTADEMGITSMLTSL